MEEGIDEGSVLLTLFFKKRFKSHGMIYKYMIQLTISEGFRRNPRLSMPGQRMTNYLRFLEELAVRQASGSLSSQLFSTAVISGSSSSPNLGSGTSFCDIGEDGKATIRPLETLHNALSLRQVDAFLDHVTTSNFKPPTEDVKEENE